MNETERKALAVLHEVMYGAEGGVSALSRAGLLATPLHERALEACKAYRKQFLPHYCEGAPCEVALVGEEALALEKIAEKPLKKPERWTVRPFELNAIVERDGIAVATFYGGTFGAHAEREARAYAAQKNAEAAMNPQKEAAR